MKPEFLIIHHTAVSHKTNPDQFDMINEYHRQKWNVMSSLGKFGGYNYLITASGNIRQYRLDGEETVAAKGYNFNSIHIALCGDFNNERPTFAQTIALKTLINEKMREHNIFSNNILTHRMITQTSCPGNLVTEIEFRMLFQPDLNYLSKMILLIQWKLAELKSKLGGTKNQKVEEEKFS